MTIATPEFADVPLTTDYVPKSQRSLLRRVFIFCRRQPLGTFGMVLVVIMAIAGLCAGWIAPYSPTANDFSAMTEPPSWAHWLGTDQFGRDHRQFHRPCAWRRQRLFRRSPRPLPAGRARRGDGLPRAHPGTGSRRDL